MRPTSPFTLPLLLIAACADTPSDDLAATPRAALLLDAAAPADPGDRPGVSYRAIDLATGLVRVAIVKLDPARGHCTRVVVVAGGGPSALGRGVDAQPASMRVERAFRTHDLDTCLTVGLGAPDGVAWSREVTGTLRARRDRCALDVDLTVSFSENDAGLPTRERLRTPQLSSSFACIAGR
ncbi:MAG: hypothetical protein ABW252_10025 [Polyangiales bacterium]